MWFNLLMFASFVAVAYFQFLQGAYSALIMSLITLVSVCVTFDSYEWVAAYLNYDFLAGYQFGIAFLATFAVVLSVLRMGYDTFAPANMYFQTYVDRPIAGLFGVFVGMAVSGMIAIGFQMLPFGPDILGFDRIGIVAQPIEARQEQSRTDNKVFRNINAAMELSPEYAKGLNYRLWLNQDEFAFGLYRRLLLDNNMLASGKQAPKDHFGQDIDSNEFLARCWDWRIQARFAVTPVSLRVPIWSVYEKSKGEYLPDSVTERRPLQVVGARKLTPAAYEKLNARDHENGANDHVLVSVQFARGAGVGKWYTSPAEKGGIRKGGFPPVVPAALDKRFRPDDGPVSPDDPGDEFAAFAFWQMRLVGFNARNETKEFPLRAVFGLSAAEDVADGPAVPGRKQKTKRVPKPEFVKEIVKPNNDNVPSGNISVLAYPPDDGPLQFRLLFFVDKEYSKKVQLIYTRIPPDTRLLGNEAKRAELLEFRSPQAGPMPVGNLSNPLVDDEVVRLK